MRKNNGQFIKGHEPWNIGKTYLTKKRTDLTGQNFGKLFVIKFLKRSKFSPRDYRDYYLCKCTCGQQTITIGSNLRKGTTKSCGCLKREQGIKLNTTHNMSKTRFYYIWNEMKQRCQNCKHRAYKHYGGRGINFDESWVKFENFRRDMYPSYLVHVDQFGEKDTQIDRIDSNGHYYKENCRWASCLIQQNNRRFHHKITFNNRTLNLSQWAKILKINRLTIYMRLKRGWPIEKALNNIIK